MTDFIVNWKATYKDGTTLLQFEDGKENKYTDIDRSKLEAFQIFTDKYESLLFTLILGEGQRLIYRRRVTADYVSSEILYTVYLVGWQKTVNGKNIQSVAHITEAGIIQAPEFLTIDRYTGKLVVSNLELRAEEQYDN